MKKLKKCFACNGTGFDESEMKACENCNGLGYGEVPPNPRKEIGNEISQEASSD